MLNAKTTQALTLTGALTLLLAMIAVAIPRAEAQDRGGVAWEYAELTFTGFDAVLNTGEKAWLLEGPDRLDPIRIENNRQLSETPSLQALHLNTLGRSGWEIVPASGGGQSSFLLRRRI